MRSDLGLIQVSVAGREPIWFCVDPDADDPVSDRLLGLGSFDGPAERVALDLLHHGMRVLDLGGAPWTLALPAAALGAEVAAVDTSDPSLELARHAAARNGFTTLAPVRASEVSTADGLAPWPGLEALLAAVGWDRVDLIRLGAGGPEPSLLEQARCLRGPHRPAAIVFDCDAAALARLDSSVPELQAVVTELGYSLFMIDTVMPGTLIEVAPGDVQPGSREAHVALDAHPASALPGWRVASRLDRRELVRRIVDNAASDEPCERSYAAGLIGRGPDWLRRDPAVPAVLAALEVDVSPTVRTAVSSSGFAIETPNAAAQPEDPADQGAASRLVLLARDVSVRSPSAGFERPAGASRPDEVLLSGFTTHLRAGSMLGVVVEEDATAAELLSALAGIARVADGELSVRARPVLVSRLDRLVEPGLTVAENIVVLGVFFGGHVADIVERTPEIAERAGLLPTLTRRLSEVSGVDLGRLGLALALDFAAGSLLLVDSLGLPGDAGFRRWAHDRLGELLFTGTSIVQAVRDPSHVLRQPDRLIWAAGGRVVASGHPESVSFAVRQRAPWPEPPAGNRAGEALATA